MAGWILGDGEDRPRLEALAARSPAHDRIRFLGMQPHIADWLRALDVFVLPSGPEESFGNAVVEAMACGVPVVVSSDSPAHVEHVDDDQTGFVVRDAAHLAERLADLIADPRRARAGWARALLGWSDRGTRSTGWANVSKRSTACWAQ